MELTYFAIFDRNDGDNASLIIEAFDRERPAIEQRYGAALIGAYSTRDEAVAALGELAAQQRA